MAKTKTKFVCQECTYESRKWMGRCPSCQNWNTLVEEMEVDEPKRSGGGTVRSPGSNRPQKISQVDTRADPRITTKLSELNRVLGGGIVPGSLVLVGGDPGIGKSTLLLQLSTLLAEDGKNVLYISGEESVKQTKMRADRLKAKADALYVLTETDTSLIAQAVDMVQPDVLVIDSVQTMQTPDISSAPGSVAQVRESTSVFMSMAKSRGISVFVVGHVTKQGSIAGPKMLEHMVDAVLYFEGERHHTFRILRAVKNRFGSTNEIGIFDMNEEGLREVLNPSEIFLEERSEGVAGATVVASLEGTRPVLVEMQALVAPTSYANPRRTATGVDHNRVSLLMAVLERRVGMLLQNQDAYINVAGGVKLDEPAVDLALATSIASSFRNQTTRPTDVAIGEVGLTGEIRRVARIQERVRESAKLGFKRCIIPEKNLGGWNVPEQITCVGVGSLEEALDVMLDQQAKAWQ